MTMLDRSEAWNKAVEQVMIRYKPRIEVLLNNTKTYLENQGYSCGIVTFLDGDDYKRSLLIYHDRNKNEINESDVDITFTICDSTEYEGTEGGITFRLDIIEWNGAVLGGLSPYNYTEKCWVPLNDDEAIEERFRLIEEADFSDIPALLDF